MSRRVRVALVAALPAVVAGAVAAALGLAAEIAIVVTAALAVTAAAGAGRLLEFVDRPLAELRRAAGDAAAGRDTGRPLARATGETGRLARAVDELAERLRAAEASAREQAEIAGLFEHLGEGIAVVDAEGRVTRSNGAFRAWVGRESPEGERLGTLLRDPGVRRAVETALSGETASRESRRSGGVYLVHARPFGDRALLTVRDVTELRRLEGVRRDFVANVSHELKTPLTSVTGFAEALAGDPVEPERVREFGRRILDNAHRMRRMVDDLLDLARVESGAWEPTPEELDVAAVAAGVWRALPPELRKGRSEPRTAGATGAVRADREALRQILRNLLENALRYTPPDTPVTLRTTRRGGRVRVEVSDRGPGIPLAHRDRVFERFYRVDAGRSRPEGGTGLGLAIAKHLVLAHGGEIGVESELDRGTTVWFTLPAP